ncbi:MAG: hypothetical protein FWB96_08445 [Defluviitaleaceae bacterium]|nr:hypothetical protein [Defluviitaleaceae bacterium]MCL2264023.1 hypothetical protein [Defluviitaleaceae bacterium]
MKIKLILTALVMIFALAACGGGNQPTANEPTVTEPYILDDEPYQADEPTEPDPNYEDSDITMEINIIDEDEFLNAMEEFIAAYGGLIEVLGHMVNEFHEVDTDEEMAEWVEMFGFVQEYVGLTLDLLWNISPYVPDGHAVYFASFAAAIHHVYDAMTELDFALSAAMVGDDVAVFEALEAFQSNISEANALIFE